MTSKNVSTGQYPLPSALADGQQTIDAECIRCLKANGKGYSSDQTASSMPWIEIHGYKMPRSYGTSALPWWSCL
ncbi:MAG TPA: hypothetical protein VK205_14025 [Prolixibacteraceae bacterium]|nr:hypothetical protein [Prolixibacteraceae bacterium]